MATFRERLLATLRAVEPILDVQGDRDLLVVAGLLAHMNNAQLDELVQLHGTLSLELRHQVRSNLSILSLLGARPGMPDPRSQRVAVDALLQRLEEP